MSKFSMDFVSDTKREHLFVEIYFDGQRFCQINRENGLDALEIEFLTDLYKLGRDVPMVFQLSDFEAVLQEAKAGLLTCE
jgi:hypothetical protein